MKMKDHYEEFRQYCEHCTDSQLRNVYEKERAARRTAYASIAKEVMNTRGLT